MSEKLSTTKPKKRQNYIIVWVDTSIDADDVDTKYTKEQLEKVVNQVILVNERVECIRILNEFDGTRSFVITSGSLGQTVVPQIHSIHNLESIFMFCGNKTYHKEWSKNWVKVKQVETEIGPICKTLSDVINQVKNDEVGMSFIKRDEHDSTSELRKLEPSFMYTALLKDTLLKMKFTSEHIQNMIQSFKEKYRTDPIQSEIIVDFEENYQSDAVIWWYTSESFIYNDINRALRDLEGDIIIDMGYFIHDLHKQIEQLHQEQLSSFGEEKFILYRGQGLPTEAFEKIKNCKGGLLGFNCFLSTSLDKSVSVEFAVKGSRRPGCIGAIFVMTINPSLKTVPFAKIQEHSAIQSENEVLFAMHTIFEIGSFEPLPGSTNIFQISLEMTSEEDPILQRLTKYMRGQYGITPEHRLGRMLNDMGQYEKSEEIYLTMIEKTTDEQQRGLYSHQLGYTKDKQGKYDDAIVYYGKAMEIYKRILPENDLEIAKTYNSIGLVYDNMGDYSKALSNYEMSLQMKKKSLREDHLSLATSYNNIGNVYDNMGEYSKALENYEKSRKIYEKTLPKDHPDIATSYSNIGIVYYSMKQYKKALEYFEETRRIFITSLPPAHILLKLTDDWISKVKTAMSVL